MPANVRTLAADAGALPSLFHAATSGATPFRFNAHVGDLGHMLNIGPTGAGKSTLLGLKVAQWFRYPGAQVFAFDKGYSLQTLAMACGGDFYDIGGEEGNDAHSIGSGFAPLENIDTDADIAWATDYVADLCTLSNGTDDGHNPVTAKHKKAITEALRTLAQSTRKGEGQRSLTNFAGTVQDEDVRDGIYPYTLGGPYGIFLDAERDNLIDSRFMVFEMEHLMALQKSRDPGSPVPVPSDRTAPRRLAHADSPRRVLGHAGQPAVQGAHSRMAEDLPAQERRGRSLHPGRDRHLQVLDQGCADRILSDQDLPAQRGSQDAQYPKRLRGHGLQLERA
jgi:hypothetical protein